jgi:hypothetical protein
VRSPRIARIAALVALVAGAAPSLAWAGPAEPAKPAPDAAQSPSPGADEQAAHLLLAGNKAFKEGRFAEAERAYREAFAVKKGYDIAGNLGAAELAQGKLREAAQHLAFTLRMFPITGEPALREQMTRAFEQCRQGVGAVRVKLDVPGAVVLVDGVPQGEAPLLDEVFVEPGEHLIEARAEGYNGAAQRVTVPRGGAAEVGLVLTPVPRPVSTVARVAPLRRRSLLPGLGLAAVAAVGLGGGAVFISMSAGKRGDERGLAGQILANRGSCVGGAANYDAVRCPTLMSTARADDTFHDVAVGAFIAGSAAAVATAAYFFWPQRALSTGRQIRVTPVVGAGDGGVVFSGSF